MPFRFQLNQIPSQSDLTEYQLEFHDLNNIGSVYPIAVDSTDLEELYQFLRMKRNSKLAIDKDDDTSIGSGVLYNIDQENQDQGSQVINVEADDCRS
jgi:beta-N-acetylglucosaminidase